MSEPTTQFRQLLLSAKDGDENAIGTLLIKFRPALRCSADQELGNRVRVRADASDLVQQTILSAIRKLDEFAGDDEMAFVAWLQQIQNNNVRDCLRQNVRAECRSVNREVAMDDSKFGADRLPQSNQAPPEQRILDKECSLRLQEAVTQLPSDQQEAVRMRHLDGKHLDEIANAMGKTKMAVASLITRGLRNLRSKLSQDDH